MLLLPRGRPKATKILAARKRGPGITAEPPPCPLRSPLPPLAAPPQPHRSGQPCGVPTADRSHSWIRRRPGGRYRMEARRSPTSTGKAAARGSAYRREYCKQSHSPRIGQFKGRQREVSMKRTVAWSALVPMRTPRPRDREQAPQARGPRPV